MEFFLILNFPMRSSHAQQLLATSFIHLCGAVYATLATTCDGASSNRKFFGLHGKDGEFIYKTVNPFSDEPRPLFFFSDAPHLIKTVRNCWANSFAHTNSRTLWVSNVHVLLPLTGATTIIIFMIINIFISWCNYCY